MDWNLILAQLEQKATTVGLQIIGAIVLYIIGRWLINLVVSAMQKALGFQRVEPTVLRFAGNALSVVLNITLVVAILGYFGVRPPPLRRSLPQPVSRSVLLGLAC